MPFSNKTHHMEGNPHFTNAVVRLENDEYGAAQVEATLALAFEQRTATLVAVRKDPKHGFVRSIQRIQDRVMGGLNFD